MHQTGRSGIPCPRSGGGLGCRRYDGATFTAPRPGQPAEVRLLGPEIELHEPRRAPTPMRGRGAKLLALLVAFEGRVETDRAIDVMWPECSAEQGRRRLHTCLYRLRGRLGIGDSRSLTIDDDMVLLQSGPTLRIDVWEVAASLRSGADAAVLRDALLRYRDDFCARQFAYEDFALDFRTCLRNLYATAVLRLLEAPPPGSAPAVLDIARRAWRLLPDDERVCELAAACLLDAGCRREAREMLDLTAARLEALGVPSDDLLRSWS